MTEHTATPWTYVPWHIEEGPSAVRAPGGYLVTTTASDADAAFIVTAVNAHEALVRALEQCAAPYSTMPGSVQQCQAQVDREFQRRMDIAGAALASVNSGKRGRAPVTEWQPIADASGNIAPNGVVVETKISDENGERNYALLCRHGNLWWSSDNSMYVYYTPTHWRALASVANAREGS